MIFRKTKESLRALRQADPRAAADFAARVTAYQGLKAEIMATEPTQAKEPRRAASPARSRWRVLGLSAAGAVVFAGAAVAVILLVTGGNGGLTVSPANAAEAVKKAAADTSAAAQSGVINTVLLIDGEAQVSNTISWNGEDLALVVQNDEQRQLRYVGGLYYETYGYSILAGPGDTSRLGEWIHCTDYDNGGSANPGLSAVEAPSPSQWLNAARTDLAGDGLVAVVSGAGGYTQSANDDGSITYAGTTTVAAIQSQDWSLNGLPIASQPSFKVLDTNTPVAMRVSVGADGLIRELKLDWTLDLPGEASVWSYTTTYSELGSAPAVVAPDSDHTVTTDNRYPDTVPGEM